MSTETGQPGHESIEATEAQEAAWTPSSVSPVREVSLLDVLLVLAGRRWLILGVTLGSAILGFVIASLLKPTYTATTVILPPQKSESVSSSMLSELGSLGALSGLAGGSLGIKNPGDMYVALFQSRTVEDAVIRQFDLQREYQAKYLSVARHALEAHSKLKSDTKTSLINISVEDHDPRRAAAIANAYVDQYRHLSEHLAISEAAQRRLFFQEQMVQAKNSLADAEAALVKTEQKTGLVGLDTQARALIATAANLRAQVTAKQVQIQGMESYAAGDNAALTQAKHELAGLEDQLTRLGGNADLDSTNLLVPKGQVPEATLEYARKLRDVKYYETIFNILARQFETAKLDEAREGALVQVVDPALVPDYKSGPKRLLWAAICMMLGLLCSAGYVLAKAAMRFLHKDPETDRKLRALHETWARRRTG